MAPVSFQVVADTSSFHLANTSFLSHFAFWRLGMWFHSAMADVSFNVSFFLTPISMTTSFLNGNCFILCFIPPWQLFHAIFHSFWHSFQSNFHFFMAATSFSLGFCLIPAWQLFHAIFHSFWHVFHWNFHFFMVATSFFLRILSHSPLAAISCNISFHLACISLDFSFLHGSYFILPSDFVSFPPGSYFMQYFIPPGMYFIEIFISSW